MTAAVYTVMLLVIIKSSVHEEEEKAALTIFFSFPIKFICNREKNATTLGQIPPNSFPQKLILVNDKSTLIYYYLSKNNHLHFLIVQHAGFIIVSSSSTLYSQQPMVLCQSCNASQVIDSIIYATTRRPVILA